MARTNAVIWSHSGARGPGFLLLLLLLDEVVLGGSGSEGH